MTDPTLPPTPRRLRRALAAGVVPVSSLAVGTAALCGAVLAAPHAAAGASGAFRELLRAALRDPVALAGVSGATQAGTWIALASFPVLAAAAFGACALALLQTGARFAPRKPSDAMRTRATDTRGARLLRALLIGAVLGGLGLHALSDNLEGVAAGAGHADAALGSLGNALRGTASALMVGLIALAVLDALATRAAWRAQLAMTPDERRRELRETGADPEIARARAQALRGESVR